MSWSIIAEAPSQVVGDTPMALALEIDPRGPSIHLGIRALGASMQEAAGGAILCRYLEGDSVQWSPIQDWLQTPRAAALMACIHSGYTAEQRWSGDWVGQWTEDAWNAAGELHAAVQQLIQDQGIV